MAGRAVRRPAAGYCGLGMLLRTKRMIDFRRANLVFFYGILAICTSVLVAVLLWPLGAAVALIAAPFTGALIIIAIAIGRYAATAFTGKRETGARSHQSNPGETR